VRTTWLEANWGVILRSLVSQRTGTLSLQNRHVGAGRTVQQYRPKQAIFSQGDRADAVFYIREGKVRLSVLSKQGKEATIALLGAGDFLGEGCIASDQLG
jgi:CRP-like cAMP-binding protein